jgi:2-keto-4-pentenoate hydratase
MINASRIAQDLAAAERDRRHRPPFTDADPGLDLDTAYAAQWAGIQAKLDSG